MARGDSPPLKMVVGTDRLTPHSAWDAERLASYRNGSTVNVVITQEAASWRRRKYWAILHKVVETSPVKARTAQDLHDAIRKEIGFVDAFHSDGKSLRVTLRSTSKLDDQEFEAYFRDAMEVLTEWTGLDAETLGKESADVGHDDHEQSGAPKHAQPDLGSGALGGAAPAPSEIDAPPGERIRSTGDATMETSPETGQSTVGEVSDHSAAADLTADGEVPAETTGNTPSADPRNPLVIRELKSEAVDKFIGIATDKNLSARDRRGVLATAKEAWKKELPHHHDFVKACLVTADDVVKGKMTVETAREYLRGLVK